MFEIAGDVRVHIDATSEAVQALAGTAPYAAGRVAAASGRPDAVTVLVRGAYSVDADVKVAAGDVIALPRAVDAATALLVPPVAMVLSLWETLQLELGEVAVWTGGAPLSALVGQTALWRGACPAVELGPFASSDAERRPDVQAIDWADAEIAQRQLGEVAADAPGFAAIDLSGRADVIDSLLEVIPRWGRLYLAGPAGANVTIDFYKNVHRKGIIISTTTLQPTALFDRATPEIAARIPQALGLLGNRTTGDACRAALGLSVRPAVSMAV